MTGERLNLRFLRDCFFTKNISQQSTCNQTKYNEEKRGGDIYGKNSKYLHVDEVKRTGRAGA